MERTTRLEIAERLIVENRNFRFTVISYLAVLTIFLNLISFNSPFLGTTATLLFFFINGIFLGWALFRENALYFRLMLGSLLVTLLLGTSAWLMTLSNSLDNAKTTLVLLAAATFCSILNLLDKRRIRKNESIVTPSFDEAEVDQPKKEDSNSKGLHLHIMRLAYLFVVVLSFYLLFASRADEIYTVWQFMHPAFMPALFASTFVLLIITVSKEKAGYKLLFITVHSILIHTFFVFVFPASGDLGGQQTILGTTRILYDNTVVQDPAWFYYPNLFAKLSDWFMIGFQTSFSVVFARMFSVDVLWSHVLLIPIAWSVFVPLSVFMVTNLLSKNENVSALSSLLFSAFPSSIIWGTISTPNSLGFIMFFWSFYFTLKYLSREGRAFLFALLFSAFSFVSHYLTGVVAFTLLLLAATYRRFEQERARDPWAARTLLLSAFVFYSGVLPVSLPFVRLFTRMGPSFGFDKLSDMSWVEQIQFILFGEYVNFSVGALLIYAVGPLIGLIGMIYCLRDDTKSEGGKMRTPYVGFLLLSFLMFLTDYRILKAFVVNPPFNEERLWLFADFASVPFLAILAGAFAAFILRTKGPSLSTPSLKASLRVILVYASMFVVLSGWITASVWYAYPHYGPLQTTSYEIEAVKYIDEKAKDNYIVISDQWFIFAGEIFLGVYNPRAFYFSHWDKRGVKLFVDMKSNPSLETMMEAAKYNNATTVYFVIEKPRLGEEQYNRIIQQAQENGLQTMERIFYHRGEERLRVFYYEKS